MPGSGCRGTKLLSARCERVGAGASAHAEMRSSVNKVGSQVTLDFLSFNNIIVYQ